MNQINAFNIKCCRHRQRKLDFALVSENESIPAADYALAVNAYINFHLAIRPDVNVIIFLIEPDAPTGARLYAENETTPAIYHIPPKLYTEIDHYINPELFVVSTPLLADAIEKGRLHRTIFEALQAHHDEKGFIVLGIYNAS